MILLDTDILSLLMNGHEKVLRRVEQETDIAITIVTRIEMLQGRFASVLKAADSRQLLLAQTWLIENERFIEGISIEVFDASAAIQFDLLRQNKKFKKIGIADMLIASIALARRAVLVTRNERHFRLVTGLRTENRAG
jgi:tRNA(fMet)-specific endonuclease VapC